MAVATVKQVMGEPENTVDLMELARALRVQTDRRLNPAGFMKELALRVGAMTDTLAGYNFTSEDVDPGSSQPYEPMRGTGTRSGSNLGYGNPGQDPVPGRSPDTWRFQLVGNTPERMDGQRNAQEGQDMLPLPETLIANSDPLPQGYAEGLPTTGSHEAVIVGNAAEAHDREARLQARQDRRRGRLNGERRKYGDAFEIPTPPMGD